MIQTLSYRLKQHPHNVRAHAVHEIGRVRGNDENVVVGRKVSFKPDDGFQIQVIGLWTQNGSGRRQ